MKKLLYCFILLFLSSCGSLPEDKTPAPIDHNFYTLDMEACGKREVGLHACFLTEETIKEKLRIRTLHKGEIQIKSQKCQFSQTKRFKKGEVVDYSFEKLIEKKSEDIKSCLFDIKLFIDGMDRGLRGQFLLQEKEFESSNIDWFNQSFNGLAYFQIREGSDISELLSFENQGPAKVFWDGCEISGEKDFEGDLKLSIGEIFEGYLTIEKSCILTVGIIPKDKELPVVLNKVNIQIFGKPIVEFADPTFEYSKGKLKIEADNLTAVFLVDEKYYLEKGTKVKKLEVKVEKDQVLNIGIGTSNGRYKLYKVKNGEILWQNFIKL